MSLSEQRGWILMEGTTVFTGLHHGIDSENYMMDKAIIWADMLNNQKRPLKWAEATASGTSVDWKVVRSREEFSDAAAELTAYLMEISRQFPDLEIEFLHMRSEGDRTDHLKEADAELNVTSPTLRCSCGELIHQEILGKAPDYCDSCIDRLDEIDQEINDVMAGLLCHSCRCPIGDGNEAGEPRYCEDCMEDTDVSDYQTDEEE